MLAHADLQLDGRVDVGRVHDDEFKPGRQGRQQVTLKELQARGHSVIEGVGLGHFKRRPAQIAAQALEVGALGQNRDDHAARAHTQLDHQRIRRGQLDGQLDQQLGFGPRNQHGRADPEFTAIEFAPALNIGQGFAAGAALEQLAIAGQFRGAQRTVDVEVEVQPSEPERLAEKQLGFEPGARDSFGIEVIPGPAQQTPDGPGLRHRSL
ncbi:MAG: hypothetical protein BWY87_00436 [Deltaproteobacteria bacterium ADurb.Bin510]|nr:MAG: hypothetical protein BWY87_00436 [Deltaproteobacteria bacterium ADurb.Bin510]